MREDWATVKLGDVCRIIKRGIAPKYIEEGGICVINQKCVRNHKIDYDKARRHSVDQKSVDPERYIKVGDVLVNSTGTGTLGRVAQVREDPPEPTTVDTHVTIVRSEPDRFFQDFFGYMMIVIEGEIALSGEGTSGQTELARTTLQNKFDVSFPHSIHEQMRIVAILDEAFEGVGRAAANAEKNLANARELFESELTAIFSQRGEGWVERTLGEVCVELGRGKSKRRPRNHPSLYGGMYPFIQTGDISNARHVIKDYMQTYNEIGLAQSKLWPKGTICLAIVGATIGETGVLDFDACFPDSVIGMVVDPDKSDAYFIEYLLQNFKAQIKDKGKGSARHNINLGTFKDHRFPIPPVVLQTEIASRLDALFEEAKNLQSIYQQKLDHLAELKQSILQKAFAGELTAQPDRALKEAVA